MIFWAGFIFYYQVVNFKIDGVVKRPIPALCISKFLLNHLVISDGLFTSPSGLKTCILKELTWENKQRARQKGNFRQD
jgi:hypothetical protein